MHRTAGVSLVLVPPWLSLASKFARTDETYAKQPP
jgi:hypothetical protein